MRRLRVGSRGRKDQNRTVEASGLLESAFETFSCGVKGVAPQTVEVYPFGAFELRSQILRVRGLCAQGRSIRAKNKSVRFMWVDMRGGSLSGGSPGYAVGRHRLRRVHKTDILLSEEGGYPLMVVSALRIWCNGALSSGKVCVGVGVGVVRLP